MNVLLTRIKNLPDKDKEDLFELCHALFNAINDEELDAAIAGINEIFDQKPSRVLQMSMPNAPIFRAKP